jgi:ACT domain-containing protein
VNLSEEKLREIAIAAIYELGNKATPDLVRKIVENSLEKIEEIEYVPDAGKNSGRVILTAFGLNHPGVVSSISQSLSDDNCDILDVSQKIMQEFFTMIMMINITNSPKELKDIQEEMNEISKKLKIKIYLQHEDIFKSMHRI